MRPPCGCSSSRFEVSCYRPISIKTKCTPPSDMRRRRSCSSASNCGKRFSTRRSRRRQGDGANAAARKGRRMIYGFDDYAEHDAFDADAVVVGTGAGGAAVGAELAEAGFRVVFVEEGAHHPTTSFNPFVTESVPRLYRDASSTVAVGGFGRPPIPYVEGRCVGGTTVLNGGMTWRAPEEVLAGWEKEELGGPGARPARDGAAFRTRRKPHIGPSAARCVDWAGQPHHGRRGAKTRLALRREPAKSGRVRRVEQLRVRVPDRSKAIDARLLSSSRVRRRSRLPRASESHEPAHRERARCGRRGRGD